MVTTRPTTDGSTLFIALAIPGAGAVDLALDHALRL
jgi:hypothetical protein